MADPRQSGLSGLDIRAPVMAEASFPCKLLRTGNPCRVERQKNFAARLAIMTRAGMMLGIHSAAAVHGKQPSGYEFSEE